MTELRKRFFVSDCGKTIFKTVLDSAGNLLDRTCKWKIFLFRPHSDLILVVPHPVVWSTMLKGVQPASWTKLGCWDTFCLWFCFPLHHKFVLNRLLTLGHCSSVVATTGEQSHHVPHGVWYIVLGKEGAPWQSPWYFVSSLSGTGNRPLCGVGRLRPGSNIWSFAAAHGYKKVGINRQYISEEIS